MASSAASAGRSALHVVLVHPQIPFNTGAVGRTCLGFAAHLHLVAPLGFSLTDAAVKRAGLDYWPHVPLTVHDDWASFADHTLPQLGEAFYFSKSAKHGTTSLADVRFPPHTEPCALLFGSELTGLDDVIDDILQKPAEAGQSFVCLPMDAAADRAGIRSYNLASTVAMALCATWLQRGELG